MVPATQEIRLVKMLDKVTLNYLMPQNKSTAQELTNMYHYRKERSDQFRHSRLPLMCPDLHHPHLLATL